jgi:hypothetical protein
MFLLLFIIVVALSRRNLQVSISLDGVYQEFHGTVYTRNFMGRCMPEISLDGVYQEFHWTVYTRNFIGRCIPGISLDGVCQEFHWTCIPGISLDGVYQGSPKFS